MRDLLAGILAALLVVVALSLATTLHRYRQTRQRARDSERALGRTIIAELPAADDLVLFSEDGARFYYGEETIDKDLITAVRVLINGAPIATIRSVRHGRPAALTPVEAGGEIIDSRPDGIARDRWDVAIETLSRTLLVECGSVRERVSQELARSVFDAVRREVESRNAG